MELDATGLKCPMPVLRTRKCLNGLEVGHQLIVRTTDPAAEADLQAFCAATGHEIVTNVWSGAVLTTTIKKR